MASTRTWNLESFLDSLIMELDRAQDTLALKGVTRPLTYTVKDIALDLQLFPEYTPDGIRFTTARPGETGASRVSIQLGSISDRQIRETTRNPVQKDDITVDMIDDLDDETKRTLTKVGVKSAKDLERMEQKNIDLGKAVGGRKLDYGSLANAIAKARRTRQKPQVRELTLQPSDTGPVLAMSGRNLVLAGHPKEFPIALLNRQPVRIVAADESSLELAVDPGHLRQGPNELTIALDPHSIIRMHVDA